MARPILHGFSMIENTLLAFWGVWLLLILAAAFRVFGFSIARRLQDRRWGDGSGPQKPVALIISAKGFDLQATPRFFDAMFDQTYRDYRVIVCFERWDDPVAAWLCEHLELGPRRPVWTHPDPENGLRSVTLVCGGIAEDEGQKVHNQRAAFRELTVRDAIVAFADADILCGRDWLARLVAPINRGRRELSTTYRWLVPKRPTLPNQLAAVINASIATQGGAEWSTVLWGGSMAMTRAVFEEIDAPNLLAGSLNDDLRLSKAARATGRRIAFVRSLVLPTMIDFTWRGFFEFVKRQYTQLKFFSPILYFGVNLVLGFYVLGAVSIVAALVYGYFLAWVPVAAAYVIDQFRALARQQVYLSLFKDNAIRQKLFAASWLEHMFTPLWITLHWLLLASTWTQRRLTWAGVRYRILSKSKTRVLGRAASPPPLPAGTPGLAMIGALHDRRRPAGTPAEAVADAEAAFEAVTAPTEVSPGDAALADADAAETEAAAALPEAGEAPASAAAAAAPLPHPGAAPAILPLTFNFHAARRRPRPVFSDSCRSRPPTIERLLRKTRLRPATLWLPAVASAPTAAAQTPAPFPVAGASSPRPPDVSTAPAATPHRLLTAVEIALRKTRLEGKAEPPAAASDPQPRAGLPAADARLAAKTRLPLVPPLRLFAPPLPASRRAGPGLVHRGGAAPRRLPARSCRPLPAARSAGAPAARPVSRGPSARPR